MNVDDVMAELNKPYDAAAVIRNLLCHSVYDAQRNDECYQAVQDAMGYLEDEVPKNIRKEGANDERYYTLQYLRAGGEYVRGKFYAWDSEMNGYYRSLADRIESGAHRVDQE